MFSTVHTNGTIVSSTVLSSRRLMIYSCNMVLRSVQPTTKSSMFLKPIQYILNAPEKNQHFKVLREKNIERDILKTFVSVGSGNTFKNRRGRHPLSQHIAPTHAKHATQQTSTMRAYIYTYEAVLSVLHVTDEVQHARVSRV